MTSSPSTRLDPYVVLRGARGGAPWFRRRVPPDLRAVVGSSTITVRLKGHPFGSLVERQQYLASYRRALAASDSRLADARRGPRVLTPTEQLGVAGAWVKQQSAPPFSESDDADAARAVLQAAADLGLQLGQAIDPNAIPMPEDEACRMVLRAGAAVEASRSGFIPPPPAHWYPPPGGWSEPGPPITTEACLAWLSEALLAVQPFLEQARAELTRLGIALEQRQLAQVAARLAVAARQLAIEQETLARGELPLPVAWPDPPEADRAPATVEDALARWRSLRSPTAKTAIDAQARLQELAIHAGADQLRDITAEHISSWRDVLLQTATPATVRRRLALVRAAFRAAASDGMPIHAQVIERLGTPIASASGTTVKRRPFTWLEARSLWRISREQQGPRPLTRWAIPLGLSIGARLEELAGLRPQDIREIDGQWVVVIEPHELRRLKNDNSARTVPIPQVLIAEGFTTWAQQQSGALLFPEPDPPTKDPRLSHYASIRLGKLIRKQAGITDPAAVFHSSRHFAAQDLVDAGCEQRLIEQLLGHTTRSMTARYSRNGLPLEQLAAAQEARDWGWVPE